VGRCFAAPAVDAQGSPVYHPAMNDADLLALAADLAKRAAATILAVRARGFDVLRKHDATPVTEADHAAEALIVEGLRRATPEIPVIAEEEIAAGRITDPGEEFWLVDPLDGTREFSQLRDEFTVNVGLVRERRAVLGAVAVPAYGELFGGIVGGGAWKRSAAGEQAIHARKPPPEGWHVLASRHHASDARLAEYLNAKPVASLANMGSAIKFCRLAEGAADFYPRLGRTMEWDTAAPQAVLEAAGGTVRRMDDGGPLIYRKPDWENPSFVCTGAPG
jgi:3'(2'), 5'-bisphosphate nucleotidase